MTSRRNFILHSTAAMSAMIGIAGHAKPTAAKYRMGLQLYSVHEPLARDLAGTLKKIAAVGYEDTETYGYDPVQRMYYGMSAAAFKQLLADNGMITMSGHYDFSQYFDQPADVLMRYVDQCIEGAHALGQRYITWPWLDPAFRSIENFRLLADKLNVVGERVKEAGLRFAYHNHDFEFTEHAGENGYDIIMRETDPSLVKLQLDLYWVMHSSRLSCAELIGKQPGRFAMWHVKDMDKVSRDYSELGNGSIDFSQILPEASRAGLEHYYIEQGGNYAKDPIQSVTDSAVYFKKNLEKYLR